MNPCICGCPMHGGTCPHCGCSIYEPDDGRDGDTTNPAPPSEPYEGRYHPPRGYQL